jgi:hypothetical protein
MRDASKDADEGRQMNQHFRDELARLGPAALAAIDAGCVTALGEGVVEGDRDYLVRALAAAGTDAAQLEDALAIAAEYVR